MTTPTSIACPRQKAGQALSELQSRRIKVQTDELRAHAEILVEREGLIWTPGNRMLFCTQTGQTMRLNRRLGQVFHRLFTAPGRIVSRDELSRFISEETGKEISARTCDKQVSRLREKLRERFVSFPLWLCLRSEYGQGYVWYDDMMYGEYLGEPR